MRLVTTVQGKTQREAKANLTAASLDEDEIQDVLKIAAPHLKEDSSEEELSPEQSEQREAQQQEADALIEEAEKNIAQELQGVEEMKATDAQKRVETYLEAMQKQMIDKGKKIGTGLLAVLALTLYAYVWSLSKLKLK